jgi:hypothetical protein
MPVSDCVIPRDVVYANAAARSAERGADILAGLVCDADLDQLAGYAAGTPLVYLG